MSNQESPESVMAKLITTVNFAATKHINQRRKNKEASPYINHPIGVAYILINEGNVRDLEVLQGALLHDTVEDTATSFEELESNFGTNVRKIVEQVTDDKSLSKDQRKLAQIEHAPHITTQAKLVKMADKLYNLRDLASNPPPSWNLVRVQGYFVWAKKVTDGLRGTNAGLEKALDEVFASSVQMEGGRHPVIPQGVDLSKFFDDYIKTMAQSKD